MLWSRAHSHTKPHITARSEKGRTAERRAGERNHTSFLSQMDRAVVLALARREELAQLVEELDGKASVSIFKLATLAERGKRRIPHRGRGVRSAWREMGCRHAIDIMC